MGELTKAQRTRIMRVLNNLSGPIWHLKKDKLEKVFPDELKQLIQIHKTVLSKAENMGFNPDEHLRDVGKRNWDYE